MVSRAEPVGSHTAVPMVIGAEITSGMWWWWRGLMERGRDRQLWEISGMLEQVSSYQCEGERGLVVVVGGGVGGEKDHRGTD